MHTSSLKTVFIASAIMLVAGCASLGSDDYAYRDARVEHGVAYGVVEGVRPVRVAADRGLVGTIAGAAVGGILGNEVGGGLGRAAATVGGAVLGGIGGNAIEKRVTEDNGEEITVRLDDGALVVVTQGGHGIRTGDRVRIVSGPGGSRVEPA